VGRIPPKKNKKIGENHPFQPNICRLFSLSPQFEQDGTEDTIGCIGHGYETRYCAITN
jgi:hypothetical protein